MKTRNHIEHLITSYEPLLEPHMGSYTGTDNNKSKNLYFNKQWVFLIIHANSGSDDNAFCWDAVIPYLTGNQTYETVAIRGISYLSVLGEKVTFTPASTAVTLSSYFNQNTIKYEYVYFTYD